MRTGALALEIVFGICQNLLLGVRHLLDLLFQGIGNHAGDNLLLEEHIKLLRQVGLGSHVHLGFSAGSSHALELGILRDRDGGGSSGVERRVDNLELDKVAGILVVKHKQHQFAVGNLCTGLVLLVTGYALHHDGGELGQTLRIVKVGNGEFQHMVGLVVRSRGRGREMVTALPFHTASRSVEPVRQWPCTGLFTFTGRH